MRTEDHDMTTYKPIQSRGVPEPSEPLSPVGNLEEDEVEAGTVASGALGAVKLAAVLLLALLLWPPLAVIAFTIAVPFLVVALMLGLLSTPYFLVHHFRGHHGGHLSLLAHRLRVATRALIDLAPHRIVADVRKAAAGR